MNIYVGNLSYSATEDQVRELFSQFGSVTSVKIITDRITGSPRGFAFVEMSSKEEAEKAIAELNGQDFEGKKLRVNEANPRPPRQGGGRFSGPRGGGDRGGYRSRF